MSIDKKFYYTKFDSSDGPLDTWMHLVNRVLDLGGRFWYGHEMYGIELNGKDYLIADELVVALLNDE